MAISKKCPKCGSEKIKIVNYLGAKCIRCSSCGYDECSMLDVYPESKTSQKAKGQFSPYKAGGSSRSRK